MQDSNAQTLKFPVADDDTRDQLTAILRQGAQQMLAQMVEAEVTQWIEQHAHITDRQGRRQIVRNGHANPRNLVTGLGSIDVRMPRVHDRRPPQTRKPFTSKILPPYLRKTKSIEELIPWLYLKGISTGGFNEALQALVGPDCPCLSASTVTRLVEQWQDEHRTWSTRDLSDKHYVYVWADGIHFNIRLEENRRSGFAVTALVWKLARTPLPDHYQGWYSDDLTSQKINNVLIFGTTGRIGRVVRSYHPRHVLAITLAGRGTIEVEGQPLRLEPGMVLQMPPFVLHCAPVTESTSAQWVYMTYDQMMIQQKHDLVTHLYRLTPETLSLLELMLTWWRDAGVDKPSRADVRSMSLAAALLLERLSCAPCERSELSSAKSMPPTETWVLPVLHRLRDFDQSAPSIEELSTIAHLSESHLRARFRERFGISLGHYIRRLRIRHAISLIINQDMTASEAAVHCGFSSVYVFSRSAKAVLGVSPMTYVGRLRMAY